MRPDPEQLAGDEAYRFRHVLIRDAAYDALPKSARADLHERLADWLETASEDVLEGDEVRGYHLEQAYLYRQELAPGVAGDEPVAARAADLLETAGGGPSRASTPAPRAPSSSARSRCGPRPTPR